MQLRPTLPSSRWLARPATRPSSCAAHQPPLAPACLLSELHRTAAADHPPAPSACLLLELCRALASISSCNLPYPRAHQPSVCPNRYILLGPYSTPASIDICPPAPRAVQYSSRRPAALATCLPAPICPANSPSSCLLLELCSAPASRAVCLPASRGVQCSSCHSPTSPPEYLPLELCSAAAVGSPQLPAACLPSSCAAHPPQSPCRPTLWTAWFSDRLLTFRRRLTLQSRATPPVSPACLLHSCPLLPAFHMSRRGCSVVVLAIAFTSAEELSLRCKPAAPARRPVPG